jgi:hypothetical protein
MVTDSYDYSAQRERYPPRTEIRVLFVGESAPDATTDQVRFFYSPVLRSADNLFRGLMLALYDAERPDLDAHPKSRWLERFQSDGYYLEDLCPLPVNHLSKSQRSQARRAALPSLLSRIGALSPRGIIVCHSPTYADVAEPLRAARLPLLHDEPIPFPSGNYRRQFAEKVCAALANLP